MTDLSQLLEIWLGFQHLVQTYQLALQSETLLSLHQMMTSYQELSTYFEHQILSETEGDRPSAVRKKMRSHVTEIHRLLKLLQRDVFFWGSAQQAERQNQRRKEILAKLDEIMRFSQSMIEELTL